MPPNMGQPGQGWNPRATGANLGPQAAQAIAGPPGSSPSSALSAMPGSAPAPAPPRSRVGLVLVLAVLLLGGAAAGLYFFGDRIGVNVGGLLGESPSSKPK
jgi:hypothetical protein